MPTAVDLGFAELEVAPALAAQWKGHSAMDGPSIMAAFDKGFHTVMRFIESHGLRANGQPRAIYTDYGVAGVSFTLAVPVAAGEGRDVEEPDVTVATLPGGAAYRFTHIGPYPTLAATYGEITRFMIGRGLMKSEADWARYSPMWEEYVNDPDTTPADDLITYIYLPRPAGS
jgi:AraC family transcriptional regulator